jgi:hypothetical protein
MRLCGIFPQRHASGEYLHGLISIFLFDATPSPFMIANLGKHLDANQSRDLLSCRG